MKDKEIKEILKKCSAIKNNIQYSEDKITGLRNVLSKSLGNDEIKENLCIIVTGSFARREASSESDIDFFIVSRKEFSESAKESIKKVVREQISDVVKKMPSEGGPFNELVNENDLTSNLAGPSDSNFSLTRRMLLLLESEWLFNETFYNQIKRNLIDSYIKNYVSDHQLPQFLLNDIIRYYRTIATDFEYKTIELGKCWGIRNIKLRFSRKLLYFSAILVVAEIGFRSYDEQRELACKYFNMYPIQRILTICGARSIKVLQRYNFFLEQISQKSIREDLQEASFQEKHQNPKIFEKLKNESKHFSWDLASLLKNTFDVHHPIHHCLIF